MPAVSSPRGVVVEKMSDIIKAHACMLYVIMFSETLFRNVKGSNKLFSEKKSMMIMQKRKQANRKQICFGEGGMKL